MTNTNRNRNLVLSVILLMVLPNFLFSQNKPIIKIRTSKSLLPVPSDIYVINNAKVVDSTKTTQDGNGQFKIDIGNFYSIVVKANGYYDKAFYIDTKSISKDRAKDTFNEVIAELEMVQKNPNYELINIKPSVLFYYDKDLDKFVYQKDSLLEALARSEEFNLLVSFIDSTPPIKNQFIEYTRLCKENQQKIDSLRIILNAAKKEITILREEIDDEKLFKTYLGIGFLGMLVLVVILALKLKKKNN